jgi:D-alanyl-D-alanine carboxypeptidase (penicillin-binding protein 5/6)
MMNKKAAEIGCKNTHFSDPHGLFEAENYSTAYDMFLIARYAYQKLPAFAELVNTKEWEMPANENEGNESGYSVVNTNRLVREFAGNPYYYEFAQGIKTGGFDVYSTRDAEGNWVEHPGIANLISVASRNIETGTYKYIVVTMDAPWKKNLEGNEHSLHHAFNDHRTLYNWAFTTFELAAVIRKTDPVSSVKILNGEADEIKLYPRMEEDIFWTLLPKNLGIDSAVNPKVTLENHEIEAPVEKGAILGTVELELKGQVLGKFDLIAGDGVEKTKAAISREKFSDVFNKPWFIPTLVIIGILVIALIILSYVRKHRKSRSERRLRSKRKKYPNKNIRL